MFVATEFVNNLLVQIVHQKTLVTTIWADNVMLYSWRPLRAVADL